MSPRDRAALLLHSSVDQLVPSLTVAELGPRHRMSNASTVGPQQAAATQGGVRVAGQTLGGIWGEL